MRPSVRWKAHGLQEPSFTLTDGFVTTIWRKPELALSNVTPQPDPGATEVTQQVTQQVMQLLTLVAGEMTRAELALRSCATYW